jgi:hypothetical protein
MKSHFLPFRFAVTVMLLTSSSWFAIPQSTAKSENFQKRYRSLADKFYQQFF